MQFVAALVSSPLFDFIMPLSELAAGREAEW